MTIRCRFDGNAFVPETPVNLPANGWYEIEVVADGKHQMVVPPQRTDLATASLEEIGVGGWAYRTDIEDSVEYARRLREKVQTSRYQLNLPADDSSR